MNSKRALIYKWAFASQTIVFALSPVALAEVEVMYFVPEERRFVEYFRTLGINEGSRAVTNANDRIVGRVINSLAFEKCDDELMADKIAPFAKLRHLTWFRFQGAGFRDHHLPKDLSFPMLQEVDLQCPNITGAAIQFVPNCPELESIQFTQGKLDTDSIKVLTRLPKLRWLTLCGTSLDSSALPLIGKLTNLEGLTLSHTNVNDQNLDALLTLRKLEYLDVARTKITGAGLANIARIPKLKKLKADGLAIEDQHLPVLKNLAALEDIHLRGTRITRDGEAYLQKYYPNVGRTTPYTK